MRTSKLALLAAGLTVLAGGAAAASPAPAAAARAAHRPGPAVLIPKTGFIGVAVVSEQLAWAVGSRTIGTAPNSTDQPLIMRWNGTAWAKAPSPPFADGGQLDGVTANGAGDAWAIGSTSTGFSSDPVSRAVIEHWNGTTWQQVPSPRPALNGFSAVTAVSASNAWIVGSTVRRPRAGCPCRALIEHWDGTAWKQLPSPVRGNAFLSDIAVASARSAWAVGGRNIATWRHSKERPLLLHWDGTAWKQVPHPAAPNASLTGVAAVSPRNAWVVGQTGSSNTLIERWNGTTWKRVPSPTGPHSSLAQVTAVSARSAWAVGNSSSGGALIEHWDGTSWNLFRPACCDTALALSLSDVAASSARNAWVVGIDGANGISGLILHWNGTAWSKPRGGF